MERLNMVCGFAVAENGSIALLEKNSGPHTGLLNGIGGRVDPEDKSPFDAMQREFKEEAFLDIHASFWRRPVRMTATDGSWRVDFFVVHLANSQFSQITAMEAEPIFKFCGLDDIPWSKLVPNLRWVLPFCVQSFTPEPLEITERPPDFWDGTNGN